MNFKNSASLVAIVVVVGFLSRSTAGANRPAALESTTEQLPGTLVKWEMLKVPAGEIQVADPEKPGQKKTVKVNSVWVSKSEVLWELFDIYAYRLDQTEDEKAKGVDAESRPSKPYGAPDRGFGHNGYPALSMHWNTANTFCKWLSKKTGHKYRMPTEAEWEYAARAGDTADKFTAEQLEPVAWFWDNADDKTHPSGQKKPNAWGFLDMLGNAGEWALKTGGKDFADIKDGTVCGGSFQDKADKVGYTARDYYKPEWQAEDAHSPKSKWWLSNGPQIGLRLIRED